MLNPSKRSDHEALLTPALKKEKEWLTKNWRLDTEGRKERALEFNAACMELGASFMTVQV
jgi:hypothetical protein